jgi:hypothetical protein
MRKFFGPTGTIHRFVVESEALKGNILGDPTARAVHVYMSTSPLDTTVTGCRCLSTWSA